MPVSIKVKNNYFLRLTAVIAAMLFIPVYAYSQQPATQERVAAFKQGLAKDQSSLRRYEWIETTTVSLKGEVKSVKQNRCYYGADGKIQKVPINETQPQQQPPRRGGRLKAKIVANKKEELTDYMKQAVELLHKYIPPNPDLIRYSKETNNVVVDPVEPNKVIRMTFSNFIKEGDLLSATLNITSNSILDIDVSSYLESAKDAITLSVIFNRLSDGTSYANKTTLKAPEKNIVVVVENSGHRLQ